MKERETGGPAFPAKGGMFFYVPDRDGKDVKEAIEGMDRDYGGMTLRDYFASDQKVNLDDAGVYYPGGYKAWTNLPLEKKVKWVAELKGMIADAMIKERTK